MPHGPPVYPYNEVKRPLDVIDGVTQKFGALDPNLGVMHPEVRRTKVSKDRSYVTLFNDTDHEYLVHIIRRDGLYGQIKKWMQPGERLPKPWKLPCDLKHQLCVTKDIYTWQDEGWTTCIYYRAPSEPGETVEHVVSEIIQKGRNPYTEHLPGRGPITLPPHMKGPDPPGYVAQRWEPHEITDLVRPQIEGGKGPVTVGKVPEWKDKGYLTASMDTGGAPETMLWQRDDCVEYVDLGILSLMSFMLALTGFKKSCIHKKLRHGLQELLVHV